MSKGRIDRRDFIKGAVLTGAGLALGGGLLYGRRSLAALLAGDQGAIDQAIHDHKLGQISDEDAQATVAAYMVEGGGTGEARVVHVHDPDATSWNGQTDYWNYVDQNAVNNMVDQGLMALLDTPSVADAWQALLPNYQVGQGIAIKVNLNNTHNCIDDDGRIDALIQPVNALVRGLKQIGVAEADIWIYDAIRAVPDRFVGGSQYSGIRYFDIMCGERATFESNDPNALVSFSPPSGVPTPPSIRISDVLINATYLINMPIMKIHGYAGITLGFKNHFGTIDRPADLHDYVACGWTHFGPDYNPLIDIYLNPHVTTKTILTIGDGLFACKHSQWPPELWGTFGNQVPNSLFVSTDPVAIDCVMRDFLAAESNDPLTEASYYLALAHAAGLGISERGDPWGGGYEYIDYLRIQL